MGPCTARPRPPTSEDAHVDRASRHPPRDQLDALFGQYTAANQDKGLVYGLVGPSGLVHGAGFGVVDDVGTRPDADTAFTITSMSMSFIACSALLARDQGLLNLDAPITDYVSEFAATGTFEVQMPRAPLLRDGSARGGQRR